MTENSTDEQNAGAGTSLLGLTSLILSIYVLGAILCQTLLPLAPEINALLNLIDVIICLFFILEFFYRLWDAVDRWHFLKWNWVDLVSSIPAIDVLRWGRVFRILRVLRAIRSMRVVYRVLLSNRKSSIFSSMLLIAFLMTLFSAVAVLIVEDQPESNIHTPSDALWWAFASLTTVGYGDKFPITPEGRIIAVLLVTAGVSLFGTLSGFIAAYFIEPEQKHQEGELQQVLTELATQREKLERIEQLLATRDRT